MTIKNTPEILIIGLERLTSSFAFTIKDDTPVDFPEILNVTSFASGGSGIYELKSMVFHEGEIEDGIFSASVKQDNSHWFYYIDEKVFDIGEKPKHGDDVILLFYVRTH